MFGLRSVALCLEDETIEDDLTGRVIGCSYRVHNCLGPGFLEKVYENALRIELEKARIAVKQQEPIKVRYDGQVVGEYFADLWVDVEKLALDLSERERATLAANLLNSLPGILSDSDDGIAEAMRRDAEIEADAAQAISLAELGSNTGDKENRSMSTTLIDEAQLKEALKAAILEILEERKDLVRDLVEEAMEDNRPGPGY